MKLVMLARVVIFFCCRWVYVNLNFYSLLFC